MIFDLPTTPAVDGPDKLAREKLAVVASLLRTAISTGLSFGPRTAGELADELNVPVEKIRYHLGRMCRAGLVELRGKTRRRGVTENIYVSNLRRHVIDKADIARIPPYRLASANARLLRLMFKEAMAAARTGDLNIRQEYTVTRFPLPLDQQGWREATNLHGEILEKILDVEQRSLSRLEASGEQPITAIAMTLFFERAAGERR